MVGVAVGQDRKARRRGGAETATALGERAGTSPMHARSQVDGRVATEKAVASDLGHVPMASGAYPGSMQWYFAAYRKPASRKHANTACV